MSKLFKRLLSLTLALIMVLSMVPVSPFQVWAEGQEGNQEKVQPDLTYLLQTFDGVRHDRFSGITTETFNNWIAEGLLTAAGSNDWKYLGKGTGRCDLQAGRIQMYKGSSAHWLALELVDVPTAVYDLTLSQAGAMGIEIYMIPSTQYTDLAAFQAAPTGLLGTTAPTAGTNATGSSTFSVTCGGYEESGNYVVVLHGTGETSNTTNLVNITLTKTADFKVIANTYKFVSNDGGSVLLNSFEAETPFDNGSWNILYATSQPTVSKFMGGNMNGTSKYAIIRLNGIAGFGTATLKFTYTTSQTAPLDFYILPGNTAVDNAKPSAEGFPETPDAQMKSYADAGNVLSQTFTVAIDKTDVYNDSVILVIRGTAAGQTVNNRLEKLELSMIPEADPDRDAAAAVDALIAAIGNVTLDSEAAIVAAREAYDKLTDEQKALVKNYQTLADAEVALEEEKTADPVADQAAADAVIALIAAIDSSNVTLTDEEAILAARAAYDALTNRRKKLVTNYDALTVAEAALKTLLDQEAANTVIAAIDAIGEVTLEKETAIAEVRTLFNALTDDQKALVANEAVLTAAETELQVLKNREAAKATITLIDAIGETITLDSAKAISDARTAYNALTAGEKAEVTNYSALEAAENQLAKLRYEDACAKIDAIGTVTLDSADAIAAARAAYKLLTDEQKAEITNYSALETAEVEFAKLRIDAIGEVNLESADAIAAARAAYKLLTDEQKALVTNYSALETAEVEFAKLRIDAIGEVDIDSADAISDARKTYNALTDEQKALVTNYSALEAAEVALTKKKIDAIGEVSLRTKIAISSARKTYDALTDEQKALVDNLSVLEAAEAKLKELQESDSVIKYNFTDPGHPKNNGYPKSIGLVYGSFTDYARSGNFMKPYATYAQPQTSFTKGKWFGMKFAVDKAGDYDVELNLTNAKGNAVTLDVYFVRAEELIQGSGNTKNQEFIDGLPSNSNYKCYKVDIANDGTLMLTGVQLDQDEYVIVMINTSGYTVQISETEKESHDTKYNFYGFDIFRTGDYTGPAKFVEQPLPDPDTDKLVYDFYMEGAVSGTNVYDPAIMEVINKEYSLNKINWTPVINKINTVIANNYKTSFQTGTDTARYPWYGMYSTSGVGEWMALKIKAPGTGKYDLALEHGKSVNGSSVSNTYVIPVSALQDLSAASIEAAIADNTYRLINTVSYKGSLVAATTELGQVDFEKGKDYIIVFHASTNKHGSKKLYEVNSKTGANELYEAFLMPQKLTVTKFVAPEPLNQKEVVYNFFREDQAEGAKVFGDKAFGAVTADYIKGNSYWKPYAHTIGTALESYTGAASYVKGTAKSYKFEGIMTTTLPTEWIAFQIKSPGKGLYTLSLTYGINTNCTNRGEIHIIPLNKLTGDEVAAVEAAIKSGDYKLQRDVNFKKGSEKYNTGKYGQFNFEYDQEYVVVFKAATNKHGGEGLIQKDGKTAYQAFMILKEMKLTFATKVESFEEEEEKAPDVTGKADAEAAAAVIALINAIGKDITLDSSAAIQVARTNYDLLTDTQKALVTNYQTLVDAETKLAELISADDKAKADAVIEKIDAIGEVTLESESKIVAARIAYTLLTNEQRAMVTNYSKLLAAEAKLAELKGESDISPMDQASADAVEALIAKIGTVTLDSEVYISAARNAYNALTDAQKLLVENYANLVAAEKAYAELKAELDADAAEKEAAKRKAQQITIMVISALVAVGAAGTVAIFAVPGLKEKLFASFKKNK